MVSGRVIPSGPARAGLQAPAASTSQSQATGPDDVSTPVTRPPSRQIAVTSTPVTDARSQPFRRRAEGLGGERGAGLAVVVRIDPAGDALGEMGRDFAELGILDEADVEPLCPVVLDLPVQEEKVGFVLGDLELPAHPVFEIGLQLVLQRVPARDAGDGERHLAGVAAELADPTSAGSGGLGGEVGRAPAA